MDILRATKAEPRLTPKPIQPYSNTMAPKPPKTPRTPQVPMSNGLKRLLEPPKQRGANTTRNGNKKAVTPRAARAEKGRVSSRGANTARDYRAETHTSPPYAIVGRDPLGPQV